MLKPITYGNHFITRLLIITVLLLCLVIKGYGAKTDDKSSSAALEPGLNYLLPIGFQMATPSKSDTNTCLEKDTVSCKTAKGKTPAKKRVYRVDIDPDFPHNTIRKTEEAFKQAELYDADYILIHMDADNPETGNTTSLIQSKFNTKLKKSKPVFFYVDSKTSSNRSLLAITETDTGGKRSSENFDIQQYKLNTPSHPINKSKSARSLFKSNSNQKDNKKLTLVDYNVGTNKLITDLLHNNNLSNFEVLQYSPGRYGKLMDLLTQRWVCFVFVLLLTLLITIQLKTREVGPHSFIILCLLLVLIGSLYEERLATIPEITAFLLGIMLLHLPLLKKEFNIPLLRYSGVFLAVSGLAFALTSYNSSNISQLLMQFSINIAFIFIGVIITLKLYALVESHFLPYFFNTKSVILKPAYQLSAKHK